MTEQEKPIAVFDSGVGGVSVLRELVKLMPDERFLYYGDSLHAPYGEKTLEEVRALTFAAVDMLLARGIKALVVACNTATAAAVRLLRLQYPSLPIVGIEPAIKPAVLYGETELKRGPGETTIVVMATPVTMKQEKLIRLMAAYEGRAHILPLPCPGLAELIEQHDPDDPVIRAYLEEKLTPYRTADAVVLGCTHYPFVADVIRSVLPQTAVFDGAAGTAREARRRLEEAGLAGGQAGGGEILFLSSQAGETPERYRRFLSL